MPAYITPARNFVSNREDRQSPGSMTAGGQLRQLREAAKAANYRDSYHYDKNIGAAVSTGASEQFAKGQQDFKDYLVRRTGEISEGEATIQPQYEKASGTINASYAEALSKLGDYKDIGKEYKNWMKNSTRFVLMTGDGPESPGEEESFIDLPTPYAVPFATALAKNTYKVIDNRIYLHGRGQEVYKAYEDTLDIAKNSFYEQQAKPISEYNSQIDTARSSLDSQYGQAVADLNVQKGVAEGTVTTAKTGLALEQQNNDEALAQIRTSYQERLGRIREALSGTIGRKAPSRSQATPQAEGKNYPAMNQPIV